MALSRAARLRLFDSRCFWKSVNAGFSSVARKCSQSWRRALRRRRLPPRRALGESGFRFHRMVTAQEEPKTSFTATPKRIFKFLGRLINSFSHFFQFISLDACGQSTFRTYDFRILLEIGKFNLRRVVASLAFDWELSVAKEIRFHFRKTFGPAVFALPDHFGSSRCVQRRVSRANATYVTIARFPEFPVQNRDLHLGAAIRQINECSAERARRFPRRLSREQTDFRLSMRHKPQSPRPA
jgi:hypothetical protein